MKSVHIALVIFAIAVCFSHSNASVAPPPQVPCSCGETQVECLADPCSVSKKNCPQGCISSYCGGCNALCRCTGDSDCPFGEWCRQTSNVNLKVCVPYHYTNESCGGFIAPQCRNQCAPGFSCIQTNPMVADVPGLCYRQCEKGKCCGDDVCVPSSNACLPKGKCVTDADCGAKPGCAVKCTPTSAGKSLSECKDNH